MNLRYHVSSRLQTKTLRTLCQDYWAGEMNRLNYVPRGNLTPAGLPWYSLTSWHAHHEEPMSGGWNIDAETRELDWPSPLICAASRPWAGPSRSTSCAIRMAALSIQTCR